MRPPRTRRETVALLAAGGLVVALSGTGATYAAFSDYDVVRGNEVGAGEVTLGLPGAGVGPELSFAGLVPGVTRAGSLAVSYTGTIPADVALRLRAQDGSAYCDAVGSGWQAKPGGSVQLSVGGDWLDYCSLLGESVDVPVRAGVAPDTALTVPISVRLAPGTDFRYSERSDRDRLVAVARQSSDPDGFDDWATGALSISTGRILPEVPAECLAAGLAFDTEHVIIGTEGDDVLRTPVTPLRGRGYLVLGLGGNDTIVGSNQADCLVGGDGHDSLTGGNQHDVLVGGEGDDTLSNADDQAKGGGNGKDRLYGGAGDDSLTGGNGPDLLDGGDGTDTCVGGRGPDLVSCELPAVPAPLAMTQQQSVLPQPEPEVPIEAPEEPAVEADLPVEDVTPPAEEGAPVG